MFERVFIIHTAKGLFAKQNNVSLCLALKMKKKITPVSTAVL